MLQILQNTKNRYSSTKCCNHFSEYSYLLVLPHLSTPKTPPPPSAVCLDEGSWKWTEGPCQSGSPAGQEGDQKGNYTDPSGKMWWGPGCISSGKDTIWPFDSIELAVFDHVEYLAVDGHEYAWVLDAVEVRQLSRDEVAPLKAGQWGWLFLVVAVGYQLVTTHHFVC